MWPRWMRSIAAFPFRNRPTIRHAPIFGSAETQKQLGKNEETLAAWREAQTKDPAGYYSERARDLLNEREPFEPSETIKPDQDLARLRTDADAWIRLTFNLESGTDLNGLGPLTTETAKSFAGPNSGRSGTL